VPNHGRLQRGWQPLLPNHESVLPKHHNYRLNVPLRHHLNRHLNLHREHMNLVGLVNFPGLVMRTDEMEVHLKKAPPLRAVERPSLLL
jgi:hypothetical protein